ncbi:hypothetical protein L596_000141 [Steinernema carpocapsae]|uniref:Uncharacterized protein n=1 Tax=Steinernema carpocapsae TaxID=34508 RepID=A0A4U8UHT1_STECR|nr:hypothetical protein L596_000141 [Steinernema carpocapsae]
MATNTDNLPDSTTDDDSLSKKKQFDDDHLDEIVNEFFGLVNTFSTSKRQHTFQQVLRVAEDVEQERIAAEERRLAAKEGIDSTQN